MQMNIEFHARRTDPETSHKAAATVKVFANVHYKLILASLEFHPGETIYQIADRTHISHVAIARRLPELERAGLIRTEGERPGPTGRMCRVWWLA